MMVLICTCQSVEKFMCSLETKCLLLFSNNIMFLFFLSNYLQEGNALNTPFFNLLFLIHVRVCVYLFVTVCYACLPEIRRMNWTT